MIQLYLPLHNTVIIFKKQFLKITLLWFFIVNACINTNAQCDVNPVANQVVCNNTATTAINFTGTATTFNWINNTPSIGLAASGTGNIASFTALNPSVASVIATITVTPSTGACTGTPINFTITVNPSPIVNITSPAIICGGVAGIGGPCNPLTASGNADVYVWSPLPGLYSNCTATAPYTGGNAPAVYAAPVVSTIYTVTGTISATGCVKTGGTVMVNNTPPAPLIIPSSVNMCLGDPAVKLRVANGTGVTQFCSGIVNIPVPDNNPAGVSSSITVSGIPPGCTIAGMTVTINMPHTRIGNMVFVLRAPNGGVLNLDYHLSATGGTGSTTGFVNTIISSVGLTALNTGINPYTGTFRADAQAIPAGGFGANGPTGMLQTVTTWPGLIIPGNVNGNWTLGFYDGVTGDVGTLTSWCLGISYSCTGGIPAGPAVWTPAAGLFSDPASTIPYTAGTPTDSVWVRPIPAGVYTYQVTVPGVPGPLAGFTNPAPISIPVGGPATLYPSNLTVSGLPSSGARVSSVVLNGISHSRSSDIDILLQSPSGQNVILMSDAGGSNAITASYTFVNAGAGTMSGTSANPTGNYLATNIGVPDGYPAPGPGTVSQSFPSINMFVGDMNGTWKFFVMDDDGTGDQGVISGGYTINFDTVPACISPPRTVVVTVGQLTTITTQPISKTVCVGNTAVFTVSVAGVAPFTYQWQLSTNAGSTYNNITDGGVFSGALTNMLFVTPSAVTMNGNLFRVLVNGGSGCSGATSAAAMLTVNPLPNIVITANPLIIGPTQTTTILSTVTPNPAATYTWYYNNSVLPGAVSSSLLVSYGSPGDYQLKVTDVNGCTNLSNIISIANSFALNMYTYPNPNGGKFQVRYFSEPNNTLQRSLTVYNNMGHRIITRTFTQTIPYQMIDVDVRAHGKSLYWVELRDANGKRLAMNRVVVQ